MDLTDYPPDADERVRRLILRRYRSAADGVAFPDHLQRCPEVYVDQADARDGSYGCDTGCEYVRFEATIRCPHGGSSQFDWGDFGELTDMLEEMDAEPVPPPREPILVADPGAIAGAKYAVLLDRNGEQVGERVLIPEGAANVALPMAREGRTVFPAIIRADTGQLLVRYPQPLFLTPGTVLTIQCDFALCPA